MDSVLRRLVGFIAGFLICANPGIAADQLIHTDRFNGSGLANLHPFWTPRGHQVVLGDPVGWVSLRADVTDSYTRIEANDIPRSDRIRIRMRHKMVPGGEHFLPYIGFAFASGEGVSIRWARTSYAPHHCNHPAGYDKVMFRGPEERCYISNIVASSLFGREITSEIVVDAGTGLLTYDLGGDGSIDFEARLINHTATQITRFDIVGYGWWTGHRMDIDDIEIYVSPSNSAIAGIDVDSAELDFGSQPVGTRSGARAANLTNIGNNAVRFSAITLEGPAASEYLSDQSTCNGATLQPGQSCSIRVRFSPAVVGTRPASASIAAITTGMPFSIALLGSGVASSTSSPPRVTSLAPNGGPPGREVAIYGSGFGVRNGASNVEFATFSRTQSAQILEWTDQVIRVVAPSSLAGTAQVSVVSSSGRSSTLPFAYAAAGFCPAEVNAGSIPPLKSRQNFGPFSPSWRLPAQSRLPLAIQEINAWGNVTSRSPALNDACYVGALDALRVATQQNMWEVGFRDLASGIFGASVGLIPTSSPFAGFTVKLSKSAISALITNSSVSEAVAWSLVREMTGYVVSREARSVILNGSASAILALTQREISEVLSGEGVLSWDLAGNNSNSRYRTQFGLPETSIVSRSYYNPWSRYVTGVIKASCAAANGPPVTRHFLVAYEVEKASTGGAAVVLLDTLVAKDIPSSAPQCP